MGCARGMGSFGTDYQLCFRSFARHPPGATHASSSSHTRAFRYNGHIHKQSYRKRLVNLRRALFSCSVLLSSPSFIPLRLLSNAAPSRRHFPREINDMGRIKGRFLEASCRGCSVLVVWRVRMSRLAALKNLVAGPLANAKAVRPPCPFRTHQPIVLASTQKIFMRRSLRSPGASQ